METASVVRELRPQHRPAAGRKRSTAKPGSKRTDHTDSNGFLNHSFRSFWSNNLPAWKQVEREFFSSLSHCCELYHITLPNVSSVTYPQNISEAYRQVKEELKKSGLDCMIIRDKGKKACLTTVKRFDTGYTLYYIPVRPLWLLMKDSTQKELAQIVILLFRYLYHIAGVTYYRQYNYLYNQYETMTEWIENDTGEDEEAEQYRKEQSEEMLALKMAGDEVSHLLQPVFSELELEQAITSYSLCADYSEEIIELAMGFLELFRSYPTRSIHSSLQKGLRDAEETDCIYLEQYLSFYWSGSDIFYDMLMDMVNSELQEMGFQEEPVSIQYFDVPQEKEIHEFSFEEQFFELVDRLSDVLNKQERTIDVENQNNQ